MNLSKQEIYDYLRGRLVPFEVTEHEAVYGMEQVAALDEPRKDSLAKNLFVRDEKRETYCLITIRGEHKFDLNAFRHRYGLRRLSFATPEELLALLGVRPGSVSPLCLLNPTSAGVRYFLDENFEREGGMIGIHPNDNTATIWMDVRDLKRVLGPERIVMIG